MSVPQFLSVGSVCLNVKRHVNGEYDDNGRWDDGGDSSSFTIKANVQDRLTWQDRQLLEEGNRGRRAIRIYTPTELIFTDTSTGQSGDTVMWQGRKYEVIYAVTYRMGVLNHTKAIACIVEG